MLQKTEVRMGGIFCNLLKTGEILKISGNLLN